MSFREQKSMSTTTVRRSDLILIALLILALAIVALFIARGTAWIELEPQTMSFGLGLLVPLQAAIAGIVLTYSLVRYIQEHRFRDFALVLISANVLMGTFFYFLTNEALTGFSPLASRDRNRTLVTAFGLILAPTLLVGSLAGDAPITQNQKRIALFWGALIVPLVNLWFLFSPEPVFVTKPIGQGILSINPVLWILIITIFVSIVASLIRTTQAYLKTRGRIDLSLSLAVLLWAVAITLFTLQTSPFQIMELLWYSLILIGFVFIAGSMMMTAVIEPHEALKRLVSIRTKQLEQSERESKFYLNLWSHKMGNLLQGMIMYLELLSQADTKTDKPSKLHEEALRLSKDATLINQQVNILGQIKETENVETEPVRLQAALSDALAIAQTIGGAEGINITWSDEIKLYQVIADDLLSLLFVNLFVFFARTSKQKPVADLSSIRYSSKELILEFSYEGISIPFEAGQAFFEGPSSSLDVLNLDIYSVKILMDRYGGSISYEHDSDINGNYVTLVFRSAEKRLPENP
jgi:hypothetical protein